MLPIQITGHNIEITPILRDFINKKFSRIKKHADNITNTHVYLEINKLVQKAEATVHVPSSEIFAKAQSEDMYKTIDLLINKIVRQLEKYKSKH